MWKNLFMARQAWISQMHIHSLSEYRIQHFQQNLTEQNNTDKKIIFLNLVFDIYILFINRQDAFWWPFCIFWTRNQTTFETYNLMHMQLDVQLGCLISNILQSVLCLLIRINSLCLPTVADNNHRVWNSDMFRVEISYNKGRTIKNMQYVMTRLHPW